MQLVNYAPIPNTKPIEYLSKLVALYQFMRDHDPDFRAFRRFMREEDIFDKDSSEALFDFLGITAVKGKPIKMTKFLARVHDAETPVERQNSVFHYLSKRNEILVKYVMDGLAERLYSTNELYRFITSYVYPGDYITLVHFRYWMEWLQATGHIKMIGIRWGLSTAGEEAMRYIKTIDVDEILEDEEESIDRFADDDVDEDSDSPSAVASPEPEVAPVSGEPMPAADEVASASQTAFTHPGMGVSSASGSFMAPAAMMAASAVKASAPAQSEAVAPATPMATSVAPAVSGAPAVVGPAQVVIPAGIETVQVMVQPISPDPDEVPLRLVKEAFEAADEEEDVDGFGEPTPALTGRLDELRLDEDMVADNLQAVLRWWQTRPVGKPLHAINYGFTKEAFDEEPAYQLFRLASLAVSLFRFEGRLNVGKGGESFALLDQMGFFTNLFKSRKSVDTVLEALFKGGLAQRPELFTNLHFMLLFRRALKALKDEDVRALGATDEPDEVVAALWQHLGHFSLHYEVLWMVRELHALGV